MDGEVARRIETQETKEIASKQACRQGSVGGGFAEGLAITAAVLKIHWMGRRNMEGIKAFSSLKEQVGGRAGRDGRVDSFLCCVAI